MALIITNDIYSIDSKGKVRSWHAEVDKDNGRWRSVSGLLDGKKVTSKWTVCVPKSRPTAGEQAEFEAYAEGTKKLARAYASTIEGAYDIDITWPMLAETFEKKMKLFTKIKGDIYTQPKLDGIRCIARSDGLWTREGQPIVSVPHIWEELQPYFEADPDLKLDGELYNHDLHDDFNMISSIIRKEILTDEDIALSKSIAQYHVYDIPSKGDLGFGDRSKILHDLFFDAEMHFDNEVETPSAIRVVLTVLVSVDATFQHLDRLYEMWMNEGFEGQMIRFDKPYEEGKRSNFLLKRKEFDTNEFPLIDILAGNGNWGGIAKKVVCSLPDGRTFSASVRGDMVTNRKRLKDRETYIGGEVTVRHKGYTPGGIPRHGVVIDWHPAGRGD